MPERLRGETATFDIKVKGKVIVEEGRRITARHIRELEKSGVNTLVVPEEYLVGKTLAHDVVDTTTGEVIANANDEINRGPDRKLSRKTGVKEIRTLYTNDLDRGPYISRHPAHRSDRRPSWRRMVEIYRMMRPGEPPTKEAAQNLFQNLFFTASAMTCRRSAG